MKVKAIKPFTAFAGEMIVFNSGDVRELPDAVAEQYIEAGLADKAAKGLKETPAETGSDLSAPDASSAPVVEAEPEEAPPA
jgi:hypothetical protein